MACDYLREDWGIKRNTTFGGFNYYFEQFFVDFACLEQIFLERIFELLTFPCLFEHIWLILISFDFSLNLTKKIQHNLVLLAEINRPSLVRSSLAKHLSWCKLGRSLYRGSHFEEISQFLNPNCSTIRMVHWRSSQIASSVNPGM